MNRRLTQLKALSWYEWQLLLAALLLLPFTALALHLFGFKQTKKMMSCLLPAGRSMRLPEEDDLPQAKVVARMVAVAANHGMYRASCLKQSLVLWWLLARRRILSEIKIGVNREGTEPLKAHAWVEFSGQPLIDHECIRQQFSAFEIN